MSGLEEVGIAGPDHLREALTNCSDPLAAIEEFQVNMYSDTIYRRRYPRYTGGRYD